MPVNKGRLLMDIMNKTSPNKDANASILESAICLVSINFEDGIYWHYTEIDDIAPLPLYALITADMDTNAKTGAENADAFGGSMMIF
ncbi:hypothetical protein KIN20_003648 [Parelaphostrongylus tenuis]|uniref:Uncharacterized protein n=1 Tax=Parelaphostrongylus tenuis TaxID=148309 RepID=A0AAD5MQ74_PARTN|nr:hypothetical protein KIN20_003648 [Parelaphostrongylus tenuis]